MDAGYLETAGLDPAAATVVDGYLSTLELHLPAGRRVRTEILSEVADGLACAVEQETRRGQSPTDAAHWAVTDFGDPRTLAASFTSQLAGAAAHRVGLGLVATGPLVGLTWVAAYASIGQDWRSQIAGVVSAIPLYPIVLAVTVPAAMVATTGAGWAARRVPVPSRLASGAAFVAAIGCVAGDLSLLTAAVVGDTLRAGGPTRLVFIAAALSLVRLCAAGWAGHRMARLRAAVN